MTFAVGNARQAAYFYHHCFGFDIVAYRGPETGCRETATYVLTQNDIVLHVTSAPDPDHPIARHVQAHGDGIIDLALLTDDPEQAQRHAAERGATLTGAEHRVAAYGDTTHTFRRHRDVAFSVDRGFQPFHLPGRPVGLRRIDHAVANVETGRMEAWVDFYQRVFGFYVLKSYTKEDISTQFSALVSKVMANASGTIKLPINEPAPGLKKSQIQEYLDAYRGEGIQHLAIATDDIITTVRALRDRGVQLMTVPDKYYAELQSRIGPIDESLQQLAELGILVDEDEGGYLLQIFTQPLQDRPTLFFEIIQRHGADGFGKGNFRALFEAIERDQEKRGNL